MTNSLLDSKLNVLNVGIADFAGDIEKQNAEVTHLDWAPPGYGNPAVIEALEILERPENAEKIQKANKEVVDKITGAQIILTGYGKALDTIPGMTKETILHAGPPIKWEDMSAPLKGAIQGAVVFEGLAKDLDEALEVIEAGKIKFSPCHHHQTVGSMVGVTSASMYVHIVENKTEGNIAYTNLSEQMSKILRMGSNDQSVIDRLNWMRDTLGPMLAEAMELHPTGIDLRHIVSQALHMGDELHNRNVAGSTLLIQELTPYIIQTSFSVEEQKEVFDFVASSDYFSGPTWMAFAKAALDGAVGVKYSSIVTTMARNGTEFGIRVGGLEDNPWFTGPAQKVKGLLFAGYTEEDAGLDVGDSAITETFGLGGFSLASAPAIVSIIGGTVNDSLRISKEMQEITTGSNPNITMPPLNFLGLSTGIDIIKVIQTNILPLITTAITHKEAGIGMIGAGTTNPPAEIFQTAIIEFAKQFQ